jgi:hypothetical protein
VIGGGVAITGGERAALVRDVAWAGPAYSTLCNYGLVAKSFGQFSRRREKLTFTHHASVYRLPAGEADRILALAEAEHRSTRWVEDEIRTYFRDHAAPNWWDTSQQPGSQDDARTVYAVSVQAEPARPVTIPVFHRVEPARTVTLHAGQVIPDDRTVTLHARPVIRDDDAISPLTSSHTAIDQVVDAVRTALSSPQLSPQAAMAAIAATVEQSLPQATNHSLRPKLELLQQLLGGLADIVEPAA